MPSKRKPAGSLAALEQKRNMLDDELTRTQHLFSIE